MARRSNRLIFAFWDDRNEDFWTHLRRGARRGEHFNALPPLIETSESHRRTIYSYGKGVRAKQVSPQAAMPNNLRIKTLSTYSPGPAAGEVTLLRKAMAMVITSWEPYVCGVTTKALEALFPDPGPFREAWMLYIHPDVAASVTPPDVSIVETAPDGGLLLVATGQPFKVETPDHVEAARRIGEAVRHLNVARPYGDAPWPPYPGYKSINFYEERDLMWLDWSLDKIVPDQTLYPDATNIHVIGRVGPP